MNLRDKLEAYSEKVPESGCWLWTKAVTNKGYGRISVGGREQEYAHRVSYEQFVGQIPSGLFVLHRCDVRCCVNPEHLFLGSDQDNVDDMMRKGRHGRRMPDLTRERIVSAVHCGVSKRDVAEMFGVSLCFVYRLLYKEEAASA